MTASTHVSTVNDNGEGENIKWKWEWSVDYLSGISMISPDNVQRTDEIVYVSEDIL